MKSYDNEARRVLKTIKNRAEESDIVKFGKWTIRVNDKVMYRIFRESVRKIDAMDRDHHYLVDKYPQRHDLIDREARNIFSLGLKASALKHI